MLNNNEIHSTTFTYPSAEDQYPISATLVQPTFLENKAIIDKKDITVIIAGATGVPQTFYLPFAQFLARHGCKVYTFDYRGIGASKPFQSLKGFKAFIVPDWKNDLIGLLHFVHSQWKDTLPPITLVVVGHSVGGHLSPLVSPHVTRFLWIGVGTAYVHQMDLPYYQKWMFSRIGPRLASWLGYFPSPTFGLGATLPAGVGLQWATWSRSRSYHTQHPTIQPAFQQCGTPTMSLLYSNDALCSPANALDFLAFLPNCSRTLYFLPQTLGHFHFFKRSSTSPWQAALPWILEGHMKFAHYTPWVHADKGVGGLGWADHVMKTNPPISSQPHL
ncbi:hypothetical protein HMI54_009908 [Coelomomyces lativittatus]|nr:hypothetical protein HMI54_009908 [Coelomomyces lativittatus]KAJ1510867.1 hypothetical protein HMI56_006104 [Coelomomyces lativittatus]KAJ1511361.1 hypothetical protein HMI55_006628 [Coelomomyces lativittatus]